MARKNEIQNNNPENNVSENHVESQVVPMLPVVPVLMATYTLKQFNFILQRQDGPLAVKVFSAPYALWWIGDDNKEVDLAVEEVDAIHQYLRTMGELRRQMQAKRFNGGPNRG